MPSLPDTPLYELEALEIAKLIRDGELSSVDITQLMLHRVDTLNPHLHSYICFMTESALACASQADADLAQGIVHGPLHGVPLSVKDMFMTREAPTTAGMPIHLDNRSDVDATPVKRLRDGGTPILGKLVLTEGVYADHTPPFRAPVNPWSAQHWSGASSSGSGVAVASGMCFAALGSETGGSIRLPSAANGVTGLKPTWGRVSRHGAFELAASLDHVGVLAKSVADAGAILGTIAGRDVLDPTSSCKPVPDYLTAMQAPINGVRIGVDWKWIAGLANLEVQASLRKALQILCTLGADVVEISMPDVQAMIDDWVQVCAVQTAYAHREHYPQRKQEYGASLAHLINIGQNMSGMAYQEVLLRRADFTGRLEAVFQGIHAIAMPVLPFAVPDLERMKNVDLELIAALHTFTCPFNMSGSPSLTLPCGVDQNGLPLVYQLVGPHFSEDQLLQIGHQYQQSTDWHRRRPVIA
ncbi:amidase [Pseudomonas sp. NPDC089752]|uniref:amidase n=1 Tax=Pseudomonas sp. NPDC089752 TaxID=3364472 RepID=UPI0038156BEA